MKTIFAILFIITTAIFGGTLAVKEIANYSFENKYGQYWSLADKSSTIQAKQKHIQEFVEALEKGFESRDFATHNAIFLKTPNNEFKANLAALQTLSARLSEIQNMDSSSFQYNTALQQITGQEQGEAAEMIGVFKGCYMLENYPIVWGWIGTTILLISGLIWFAAICAFLAVL